MIENLIEIPLEQLLNVVQNMNHEGFRFVTASCVDVGDDTFEVTYHFDKDFNLQNYRIKINKEQEVLSISKIYFCAILVENEIKELFGVKITNILIDYGGHMLLANAVAGSPMAKSQITIEQRGGGKNV